MKKRDHIGDDGNSVLAGIGSPSSSVRRSGQPVILIHHRPQTAASVGLGDAIEPEGESFSSLGSIAVRLVASWTLPRMQMLPVPTGEEISRDRLPNSQLEDD